MIKHVNKYLKKSLLDDCSAVLVNKLYKEEIFKRVVLVSLNLNSIIMHSFQTSFIHFLLSLKILFDIFSCTLVLFDYPGIKFQSAYPLELIR